MFENADFDYSCHGRGFGRYRSLSECQSLAAHRAQSEKIQDYVYELIHKQAMNLDMSFYDNNGFYDKLHRARIDVLSRHTALIENACSLLQSLTTLLAMAGVLLTFGI
jgi:hypothetical protein